MTMTFMTIVLNRTEQFDRLNKIQKKLTKIQTRQISKFILSLELDKKINKEKS